MDHKTVMCVGFSTVRDVLSLFRDKTVRDVLDPYTYVFLDSHLLAKVSRLSCYDKTSPSPFGTILVYRTFDLCGSLWT